MQRENENRQFSAGARRDAEETRAQYYDYGQLEASNNSQIIFQRHFRLDIHTDTRFYILYTALKGRNIKFTVTRSIQI